MQFVMQRWMLIIPSNPETIRSLPQNCEFQEQEVLHKFRKKLHDSHLVECGSPTQPKMPEL